MRSTAPFALMAAILACAAATTVRAVLGTPEFGTITNTLNTGRTFRFGLAVDW